jgi:hypothetical protein
MGVGSKVLGGETGDRVIERRALVTPEARTVLLRGHAAPAVLTPHVSRTTNQTIKAATMRSITVRIFGAVRRSLAAPRACQSRHRMSASTSGMTAV